MKKRNFLLVTFALATVSILFFVFPSCNPNSALDKLDREIGSGGVLKKPVLLERGIELPEGTKWNYTNPTKSEIQFELPEGYEFLTYNHNTNIFERTPRTKYSCTHEGENAKGSCIVFYNEDVGFGCLQGDCKGSCVGRIVAKTASNITIEGVLYVKNDMLDAKTEKIASLTEFGKKGIFTLPEFKNEILRTYDILYKKVEKVDFDNIPNDGRYVFAQTYLYGVEIMIVMPNDKSLKEFFPNLRTRDVGDDDFGKPKCTCSGGGSGTCKLEKKGLLGYVVYYCTGCTTCTMKL